jgi:integrase
MAKMKLTQSKINGLKQTSLSKIEICDTDQIGFYVEVRANSSTYYQRFKDRQGKQRSYKIALTHELTLKEAKRQGGIIKSKYLTGLLDLEEQQHKDQRASITLNDYYTTVYQPQTATVKRAKTKVSQRSVYDTNIKDSIGDIPLNKITKKDLIKVQDTMQARGLKAGSINKVTSLVRHIVQHAIDREYISHSTIIDVKLKPADAGKERYLTQEEVTRLLTVLSNWETRSVALLLTFTLATGARVGEVMLADWSHVIMVK